MSSSPFDFPQSKAVPFAIITAASYASTIPVVKWLVKPSGLISTLVVPLLRYIAGTNEDDVKRLIIILTVFYLGTVYIVSGAMSATGQLIGNKQGYRNKEPRLQRNQLGSGIAHRMVSTHDALYDIFPAFAVTAALIVSSPPSTINTVPMNALVLHVFLKIFVYSPAYLLNVDPLRTMSHLTSITTLVVALLGLL